MPKILGPISFINGSQGRLASGAISTRPAQPWSSHLKSNPKLIHSQHCVRTHHTSRILRIGRSERRL